MYKIHGGSRMYTEHYNLSLCSQLSPVNRKIIDAYFADSRGIRQPGLWKVIDTARDLEFQHGSHLAIEVKNSRNERSTVRLRILDEAMDFLEEFSVPFTKPEKLVGKTAHCYEHFRETVAIGKK